MNFFASIQRDQSRQCPTDPNKTDPGQCGCGNPDTDTDGDGIGDACQECCGGGLPLVLPLMLPGWAAVRRRS